ncbi:MAG: insulinase family protein [Burkholderiales bacterium]|jgi:zinc protease|nr:insulinase family protein [Burkholderiales bacterium]
MHRILNRLALFLLLFVTLAAGAQELKLPPGVEKIATVEGISEFKLPNGLRFILFPDASKPTATVNITYLVGSRHENYGETGMAHLLEHLIFKGSKNFPDPDKEFSRRGFRNNGTTWLDRTNYFSSFSASEDNLRWALAWSADAMVNSFIARKDLDSEMTVVRNEFEMGENDPNRVMFQRMQAMLYDWHNYGKSTIGARSDIENVRIENLQAFYRLYYQADNAVLTVAGKFDAQQTLDWIVQYFGPIPKPTRALPPQWTVEPTHDGEREFRVRRKGEIQLVFVGYRVPSALHPDSDGLGFAAEILGDTPNGRLYKALVQTGLAAQVFAFPIDARDPGFVIFGAIVKKGEPIEPVRAKLVETIESSFAKAPATAEEIKRVVQQSRTSYERALSDPEKFGVGLSEYIALGDWRLFFRSRDQLDKVTPAQVDAAAARYFVRDNRVVGIFEPEDAPRRAEITAAPTAAQVLADYKPRVEGDVTEAFDPSPDNLDARTRIVQVGDLKFALLPKKNRGQTVSVRLIFRWGDAASLTGREIQQQLAWAMLTRGTPKLSRQQIADEMTRLQMTGGITSFETTRTHLPEALRLVAHLIEQPSFPPAEYEELVRQIVTALQAQLDNPDARSRDALNTLFNTYPRGDPRYYTPLAERIAQIQATKLDDVRAFHREFFGTARGEISIVGDFDDKAIEAELKQLFAGRASKAPYARVDREYRPVKATRQAVDTPDKENAFLRARTDLPLRDDDADAPALFIANWIFGGGSGLSNRLIDRLRQKDGISYGAGSGLSLGSRERYATWSAAALVAPQNAAQAERALLEEIERVRRDGFTAQEIEDAKRGFVDAQRLSRSQDSTVAAANANNLDLGRSWVFSKEFERKVLAVTPEQATAAFRKYIDPAQLTVVMAGDAKKGAK